MEYSMFFHTSTEPHINPTPIDSAIYQALHPNNTNCVLPKLKVFSYW